MKVICTKTNIEFTAAGFNQFYIRSEHPLFSAEYATLLEIAEIWRLGELSEGESRVLFIALLNSTGKLDWKTKTPATPSEEIVQKYMEQVLLAVNWIHIIGYRTNLPTIAINSSTQSMTNIGSLLNTWNNIQKEVTSGVHMLAAREKIEASQIKVRKLIIGNKEDTEAYARNLARWFLLAANVPKGSIPHPSGVDTNLHEYWTELFLLKGMAVYSASVTDLEEILETMTDKLPMNSQYAVAAYQHINAIYQAAKGGILAALTGPDNYVILSGDSAEVVAVARGAEQAGEAAPEEKDFGTRTAYLLARARWKLKIAQLEQRIDTNDGDDESGEATNDQF